MGILSIISRRLVARPEHDRKLLGVVYMAWDTQVSLSYQICKFTRVQTIMCSSEGPKRYVMFNDKPYCFSFEQAHQTLLRSLSKYQQDSSLAEMSILWSGHSIWFYST